MSSDAPLGVLLMTYGSPASSEDMPRYLAAVRGGREPTPELVAEFRRRYDAIGGSPLIPITAAQAAATADELRRQGWNARSAIGMRFSQPTVTDGFRQLVDEGCRSIVAIVMSPQHSELLMSGYARAVAEAADAIGRADVEYHLAPAWYRDPAFVQAVGQRVTEALGRLPADERATAPVLLTAHSLPRRVAETEPAYLDQLYETARSVAAAAGLPDGRWQFCWQSAGHEAGEWMKPDFAELIPLLRDAGHRVVLVAPIQFLADHLEILYDIDIGAREQAEAYGVRLERIESLNQAPRFIEALGSVARQTLAGAARPLPASTVGR